MTVLLENMAVALHCAVHHYEGGGGGGEGGGGGGGEDV